ncbi:MAG: L,D-transpeptidase family protein [Pseudomonadota bacterium]
MKKRRYWLWSGAAMLCAALLAFAMGDRSVLRHHAAPQALTPEALIAQSLLEISQNHLDAALDTIDNLLSINPNFHLAHLIKGDLLLARARPLSHLGNADAAPAERIAGLRDEARIRLLRYQQQPPAGQVPKYLLQLPTEQKYALVADTSISTLYLFENFNGSAHYVTDYYISSGKAGSDKLKEGDQKTPLGVYFVVDNLPKSKLSDFYGSGAYPLNYPNEWDRRHGRNGHGIWLHGTPTNTYSRPPRASNGCVVLTNQDMEAVGVKLQIGTTPVIIADGIEWADAQNIGALRDALAERIEAWRRDWESRDVDRYLRHYAPTFSAGGQNLASWASQKRQVNAGKSWIKVKLDNLGMLLYPGKDNLAVVTFDQDYSSNNLSNRMKKRQYWILENSQWKIAYEGAA